jgi:tetratricopeptide (TPR) repeat protein
MHLSRSTLHASITGAVRIVCTGALAVVALASPAASHGDLHEQIGALSRRIEATPDRADLHLTRGDLHRAHREWQAALADYERAARLDPGLAAVDLARGLALLELGSASDARDALDRFLSRQPGHAEARVARARALSALGEPLAAAAEYTRAIASAARPRPEHYLERARALAHAGDAWMDEAVAGLDEGVSRLGNVPGLEILAIDLELKRGRTDAALARLERLAAPAARKEAWLTRRGDILEQAGRLTEAREAYRLAVHAVESLPVHRRATRTARDIEARARAGVERLSETPPTSGTVKPPTITGQGSR